MIPIIDISWSNRSNNMDIDISWSNRANNMDIDIGQIEQTIWLSKDSCWRGAAPSHFSPNEPSPHFSTDEEEKES